MDRVYWNIIKLGDFVEETSPESCNTTPYDSQKETNCENLLPPPDKEIENKVDIVGRLFGGTVKSRKLDKNEKVKKNEEEKN